MTLNSQKYCGASYNYYYSRLTANYNLQYNLYYILLSNFNTNFSIKFPHLVLWQKVQENITPVILKFISHNH